MSFGAVGRANEKRSKNRTAKCDMDAFRFVPCGLSCPVQLGLVQHRRTQSEPCVIAQRDTKYEDVLGLCLNWITK